MVETMSWFAVAVIAVFAVIGFTGVVVTSVLTLVRALRHQAPPAQAEATKSHRYASAA